MDWAAGWGQTQQVAQQMEEIERQVAVGLGTYRGAGVGTWTVGKAEGRDWGQGKASWSSLTLPGCTGHLEHVEARGTKVQSVLLSY